MQEVDGSIKIDTSLDISDLKKGVKQASAELQKLKKEEDKLRSSRDKQVQFIDKYSKTVDSMRKKYATNTFEFDMDLKGIQKGSDEYYQELDKQIAKHEKGYGKIANDLQKYQDKLSDTEQAIDKNVQSQAQINEELRQYQSAINSITGTDRFKSALLSVGSAIGNLTKSTLSFAGRGITKFIQGIGKASKKILSMVSPIKKVGGSFSRVWKMFNTMLIRRAINSMIETVKKGFTNLASYSEDFNQKMGAMTSNVTYLGNSIASSLAPMLNLLVPLFNAVTDSIVGVINMFAQLVARLTGTATVYTKAKRAQQGYTDATKKASAAQEKQLASFDTIQKLSDSSSSNDSSTDVSGMFEEAAINSDIINFADKIKELFAKGDWYSIGYIIGENLAKALDSINWNKIQNKASWIGFKLSDLINGFVEFPDLGYTIGQSLIEALNTAVIFLYTFTMNLHWDSIGKFIGDGITGAVQNFEWGRLGGTIGNAVGGIIQMFGTAIATADLATLGQKLSLFIIRIIQTLEDKIKSTDWTGIGKAIGEFIANIDLGEAIYEFLNLISTAISSIGGIVTGFFKGLGLDCVGGFLGGILQAWADIHKWLNDNLVKPLVDGIKNLLGIHSPSTVMQEIGEFMILGLLQGLQNLVSNIGSFFSEMYANHIQPWFTAEKWIELGHNAIDGLLQGLGNLWDGVTEWGGNLLGGIKDILGIHSPSTEMEAIGTNLMPGLANGIYATMQKVYDAFQYVINYIKQLLINAFGIEDGQSKYFFDMGKMMTDSLIRGFKSLMQDLDAMLQQLVHTVESSMDAAASAAESAASRISAAASEAESALARLNSAQSSVSALSSSISSQVNPMSVASELSAFSLDIPKLASGDVAMPNNPYMAIIGDNKSEQEVVSPLSTIEQAVRNVLGDGSQTVILQINEREFARAVYKAGKKETQRIGLQLAKGGAF